MNANKKTLKKYLKFKKEEGDRIKLINKLLIRSVKEGEHVKSR